MEIRPLHDRVIVRRVEEKKTTASGLIIPDSSAEKPSRGEIVAAGKGKISAQGDLIPLDVKGWRYSYVWSIFRFRNHCWRRNAFSDERR